ncbi:MAG: hypothetical protein M1825_006406 [Sarcosagium campestre]|nr:MAG: hypothetical protein M1825_006406 [Sarcosagium campestre]
MSVPTFRAPVVAGFNRPTPASSSRPHAPTIPPSSAVPAGTFSPGTKITVGSHKVVIERYLSEGGFAHVYLVRLSQTTNGSDVAVLKRVAVPDKDALANMRTEVETMKKLRGHVRHIVTYIDSHASQLKGGGYEVFLLMEYCAGGGLIDFMNTRLQNRLTEPEILNIFSDVAEGVASMHYLTPALLHRDLKVENVLISLTGSSKRYKLCDFGSTARPRPAATSVTECRAIEDDIQKHTTLQYRSPEMIDVYRKQPIDEKSDIWALGVLLYKLCYYTTPFEEQGQLAILNASFKFPAYPAFSDRVKKLIAFMLREDPQQRPNIYQVLREACLMQNIEVPIEDIYAGRSASHARRDQRLPSPNKSVTSPPAPAVGAFQAPVAAPQQSVPKIVPMRRGRPTSSSQGQGAENKPGVSPLRINASDPFAALDSKAGTTASQDELSSRFPTLDQFSILHDTRDKFDFDQTSPTSPSVTVSQRVVEHLADEAFARSSAPATTSPHPARASSLAQSGQQSTSQPSHNSRPHTAYKERSSYPAVQDKPTMMSQGTMTSPSEPSGPSLPSLQQKASRFSAPSHLRSSSQPRSASSETPRSVPASQSRLRPNPGPEKRPMLDVHRSKSQTDVLPHSPRVQSSGNAPPTSGNGPLSRSRSINTRTDRPRPASSYLESNLDFLREREASGARPDLLSTSPHLHDGPMRISAASTGESMRSNQDTNISSNVDFLRTMEEEEAAKKRDKRSSSGGGGSGSKPKRSSLPSISLSNTKTLLAGRFGDAFRRFETNTNDLTTGTTSPMDDQDQMRIDSVAGSEAIDGTQNYGQTEEMEVAPEVKRELERLRLAQEEQRVEAAAAEYRQRLADRGAKDGRPQSSGAARAASIQNKVKSLLSENSKPGPGQGTGFASASDSNEPQPRHTANAQRQPTAKGDHRDREAIPRGWDSGDGAGRPRPEAASAKLGGNMANGPGVPRVRAPPDAPPKPPKLRTGSVAEAGSPVTVSQPKAAATSGRPLRPVPGSPNVEDWEANFSQRYPSLSHLEMVETDVDKAQAAPQRPKGLPGR